MATTNADRHYLPAAGRDAFLPLYDPFTRLLGIDGLRMSLLDQAALQSHFRVLDVGCGTGSLAVLIKRLYSTVDVTGVDPDPKALARAERKARRASVSVRFDRGFADALPYSGATFDRVFSSLMFHHIPRNDKEQSLREIRRVLRPGGRLEFLDMANPASHSHGLFGRLIHSPAQMKDNVDQRILELMTSAGFEKPTHVDNRGLLFGRVAFFQATAPA
ncbi:MAG TPA: methyltransferase domain-containing protein [Povalibacter sp.]|nr:methyltransferase domain-containing protein [Povalibacter sp.]